MEQLWRISRNNTKCGCLRCCWPLFKYQMLSRSLILDHWSQKQWDRIKVHRFRIEHSSKMSLPHPNLAAFGLLPTHIVWMALPLLPWGYVDLRRAWRQNGLVVRWGLSSAADSAGPPSRGLGAGGAARQWSSPSSLRGGCLPGGCCCCCLPNPAEALRWSEWCRAPACPLGVGSLTPVSLGQTGWLVWEGAGQGKLDCGPVRWLPVCPGAGPRCYSSLGSCPCTWISKGCDRVTGFPSPLQDPCPTNSFSKPPLQTALNPHSLQPPNAPPTAFLFQPWTQAPSHTVPFPPPLPHIWVEKGEVVLLHCTHLPHVFPCCGPWCCSMALWAP